MKRRVDRPDNLAELLDVFLTFAVRTADGKSFESLFPMCPHCSGGLVVSDFRPGGLAVLGEVDKLTAKR